MGAFQLYIICFFCYCDSLMGTHACHQLSLEQSGIFWLPPHTDTNYTWILVGPVPTIQTALENRFALQKQNGSIYKEVQHHDWTSTISGYEQQQRKDQHITV